MPRLERSVKSQNVKTMPHVHRMYCPGQPESEREGREYRIVLSYRLDGIPAYGKNLLMNRLYYTMKKSKVKRKMGEIWISLCC